LALVETGVPQLAAGARTLVTPVAISLSFDTCQMKMQKGSDFWALELSELPKKNS